MTGKVSSMRIALLGTDSAIGKRTLAVLLVGELQKRGRKADMIFTGQTGWLQGWPHGVVLDAMINDFVSGGIEGAIIDSWVDLHPEFMIIEGQGTVYIGKEKAATRVERHTAVYIPSGTIHGIRNTGTRKLLVGFMVAPGKEPSQKVSD
jgi:uncharacterized NAD-dependent epimerase/dehydratase family protein